MNPPPPPLITYMHSMSHSEIYQPKVQLTRSGEAQEHVGKVTKVWVFVVP